MIFYFDFLSPFSFFSWMRIRELDPALKKKISYKPVVLAKLLSAHGLIGPAEVDSKRDYLFKYCLRLAAKRGINLIAPKTHPFNPLYALRLAVKENSGDKQEQVIDALFTSGWQEGIDLGGPKELALALSQKGLDAQAMEEKSFTKEVKLALKKNTKDAIASGAFGVPSFLIGNELFWGDDSFTDALHFLQGKDDLDHKLFEAIKLKTPKAGSQTLKL